MSDMNKRNLVYFENSSMHGLYKCMEEWQQASNRRLLSISVQQDGSNYCCIALTNPTEVVITKRHSRSSARNPAAAMGWSRARRYPASHRVSGRGRTSGPAAAGRARLRRCWPGSS